MAKRLQSPSSINMYKQCPRKYYYRYIMKMPTKPSIHLIRGGVAHSVLEDFFEHPPADEISIRINLMKLLHQHWGSKKDELGSLGLTTQRLEEYFLETEHMILNFSNHFIEKMNAQIKGGKSFADAFTYLTPRTEEHYISTRHNVQGFIDAIEEDDGRVTIYDYKTSKKAQITKEYRLQLAIYALLYQQKHGTLADRAGIFFLKDTYRHIDIDEELIKLAEFEIEQIHAATETQDIDDYPKKVTPLCKWRTGECDFYKTCFGPKQTKLTEVFVPFQ